MSEDTYNQSGTNDDRSGDSIQSGNVTGQGIAIGHGAQANVTIINEADKAYDVRGLVNPFLGLHSFTYSEKDRFAGRDRLINAAKHWLVGIPGDEHGLLFVAGASGSGKSSLAQAGIIPMLEQHYQQRHLTTRRAVFSPRTYPVASLFDSLLQLGLPTYKLDEQQIEHDPISIFAFIEEHTAHDQRNLIVLDQFEEIFTLTASSQQRDVLINILTSLPRVKQVRTHIIVTIRADYRSEIELHKGLYDLYLQVGQRIDVSSMDEQELQDAIHGPIQNVHRDAGKSLESTLLQRLIREAAGDSTYLPLLQVTLEELWRNGKLTLSAYGDNTLASAIQRRANTVLLFQDYDGTRSRERPVEQQEHLLDLCLDLIKVPLDSEELDITRVVRRRVPFDQISKGSAERQFLIDELSYARLLSKSIQRNAEIEYVEVTIIHDALIREWSTLSEKVADHIDQLRREERFRVALQEWLNSDKSQQFLLTGGRLSEAEELQRSDATVLCNFDAQKFLKASIDKRNRDLLIRRGISFLLLLLIIGIGMAGWFSWEQQQGRTAAQAEAEAQTSIASSRRLARLSQNLSSDEGDLALLLAVEAGLRAPTYEADAALRSWVDGVPNLRYRQQFDGDFTGFFRQVTWSSDEQRILVATSDGTARVWNRQTGEELLRLQHDEEITHTGQPANWVNQATWSSDEHRILTAANDGTARVWDARTGLELLRLQHEDSVNQAVWSKDDSRILTASDDGTARVWDAQTGKELFRLIHKGKVNRAAWNSDEHRILTASGDGRVGAWDGTSGNELSSLFPGTTAGEEIRQVIWSDDDQRFAAMSRNRGYIVDTRNSTRLAILIHDFNDIITQATWSKDRRYILTVSHNLQSDEGIVRVFDVESRSDLFRPGSDVTPGITEIFRLRHEGEVNQAIWNSDETRILTASDDNTARVWDSKTGAELARLPSFNSVDSAVWSNDKKHILLVDSVSAMMWDAQIGSQLPILTHGDDNHVLRAMWSSDEHRILTIATDSTVRIWELESQEEPLQFKHDFTITDAEWNSDERRLLTASSDGTVRVWDTQTGVELLRLQHDGGVNQAMWNGNEQEILTASGDGTARVWNVQTGVEVLRLQHTGGVRQAKWNSEGRIILTISDDFKVRLWNAENGKELLSLVHQGAIRQATWSKDGSRILTVANDGKARVWDSQSGAELLVFAFQEDADVSQAVWSDDESLILTISNEPGRRLQIWNTQSGLQVGNLQYDADGVITYAAWSTDGHHILTSSSKGSVQVWDVQSGAEQVRLSVNSRVNQAMWNGSETRILTISDDGIAHIWYAGIPQLIEAACQKAVRNLFKDEWDRYFGVEPYRATCPSLSTMPTVPLAIATATAPSIVSTPPHITHTASIESMAPTPQPVVATVTNQPSTSAAVGNLITTATERYLGAKPSQLGIGTTETPTNFVSPTQPILIPALVEIPSGSFLMGSGSNDKDAFDDERPQHRVDLSTYWIGKTEVTNAQFRPFVEGDGYTNQDYWTEEGWKWRLETNTTRPSLWTDPGSNRDQQPVTGLSLHEAMAYCRWLSAQTGQDFRLPTEAEWEKAARGTDGRVYPWGNEWLAGRANSVENGNFETSAVGSYPEGASPYGALDMAGNVWEYTSSVYRDYPYVPGDGREEVTKEAEGNFVVRGGSVSDSYWFQRTTTRGIDRHAYTFLVGFRVARH